MASTEIIITAIIYESILAILCIILAYLIFKKFQEKKSDVAKYLFLAFLAISIFFVILVINRYIRLMGKNEIAPGQYIEIGAIAVSFLPISDIFYFAFCLEIFHKGLQIKRNKILFIVYSLAAIIGFIYIIVTGLFTLDLTEAIWIVIFGFNLILSLFWVVSGIRILRSAIGESRQDRIGMLFVVLGPVFMTLVMFFMIIDRIFGSAFTIWYFIGQTCTLIALFVVYIGFIRPQWVFRRIK